jgi:molecular chaperone GrpE
MREHHNGVAVTMTTAVREESGRDETYAALHDKYLRLQADLANIRRRTAAENQQARADGRRDVLAAILPALDAFERCLAMPARDGAFQEGVAAIHALLLTGLRAVGAERIQSLGRPFDLRNHDAVATRPAEDPEEAGTVVEETRAGWRLGADVVRPAGVVVAMGTAEAGAGATSSADPTGVRGEGIPRFIPPRADRTVDWTGPEQDA